LYHETSQSILPALILSHFGTLEMFTLIFMAKFGENITQNGINLIYQTLAQIITNYKNLFLILIFSIFFYVVTETFFS
jgi:hypothetical protein